MQSADIICAFLNRSLSEITNLTVLNCLLFSQHKELSNRIISYCLKRDLAVSLTNRTLCIAVMCGVVALIIDAAILELASGHRPFAVSAADKPLERI